MSNDSTRRQTSPVATEIQGIAALPSRTEAVAQAIERAIFDGVYAPGERLVERELAASLGVSKTPVREALRDLVGRGLVVNHPYRGVRVREITAEMIENLYGLRLLLEPAAVRESVNRHDELLIRGARAALEAGERAARSKDLGGLVVANRDFHQTLSAGCGNSLLLSVLDDLRDQMALVVVWDWRQHETWSRQAEEHARIPRRRRAGGRGPSRPSELATHIRRAMAVALTSFESTDGAPET